MRSMHLLLAVFFLAASPVNGAFSAPLEDVKSALEKGTKDARKAKRGSKKRRIARATRALEQFSYALRAMRAANLGQSQPELLKKVRGAIAELNALDIVKKMKAEARADFVLAIEEGRNAEAISLLERLLNIDARDAGVEQALTSLREGLGRGSKP